MHLYEHQIATNASQQMTKVTEMVREDIERSGVREGIAVIDRLTTYDSRIYDQ